MKINQVNKLYNYNLPKELIAKKPSEPRDAARLLVYDRNSKITTYSTFKNLANFLPANAILVFNQTRVIPARFNLYKPTGGKVNALYLSFEEKYLKILANKNLNPGEELFFENTSHKFRVEKKHNGVYFIKTPISKNKIQSILLQHGLTPLPPYMKDSPLTEKQRRGAYQTIFAKKGESVAAPTASLHFTQNLLKEIKKKGIQLKYVRLDVNLGTFAKLTEEQLKKQKLHLENYYIDKKTAEFLINAKKQKKPIVAVGTTVVRTLESFAKSRKLKNSTDLFISPGYKFKMTDCLITNFHVPESSLLMLVSALTGRKELLKLYNDAIEKKLRFFSFGDGMLVK
ncbi:MAG: tRNA preQ1(34) S-adenosylmethionine ribosyltransferase-isomerase QueA [Candidatus Doudnabacteria bacterium]|nr:tRNA preQ1(34) S-adenosylmethionine ribosyltransferase-isomerase QueA [Candidatus Doudnabacteria bacterium]